MSEFKPIGIIHYSIADTRGHSPQVGILATRGPQRPDPIGICAAVLLQKSGCTLRVSGLDALDGTPVLDLKPYFAHCDAIRDARVGAWAQEFGDCK